ncbi:MAG: peroxide stress protein YaaA [Planctomycetes bacterium]|nr:peroxide stress protein YaaA [Planctomycetota bacterium]
MLALISPAKRLDLEPWSIGRRPTQPDLLAETELLADRCRALTPPDLRELMSISEALAELNFNRFQEFATPFTPKNAKPAALTFAGDTYTGLDAPSFDEGDWAFAQSHLGILSGFYGLLRPLDLIQPYRLEMGTRLENERGRNLYDFWREPLTDLVNARTAGHADRRVINLASKEYIKAVNSRELAESGVSIVFKEIRGESSKVIGLFAKKARGAMASWLVRERLEDAEALKGFTDLGYAYRESLSSDVEWVFTRTS